MTLIRRAVNCPVIRTKSLQIRLGCWQSTQVPSLVQGVPFSRRAASRGAAICRARRMASSTFLTSLLVPATAMTELHEGDAGWDSSWDSSRYAYYELNHASLRGYLVRYGLEATGYIFYVQD